MMKIDSNTRFCPTCQSENYSLWYEVTYDYITKHWNYDSEYLKRHSFTPESTIEIVQCRDCKMYYNRTHWDWAYKDSLIDISEKLPPLMKSHIKKSTPNFHLVSRILNYVMHKRKMIKFADADLKVLDFSCFTGLILRQLWAFGIRKLYGFDILEKPEDNFDIPSIDYTYSDMDLLKSKGPFDIIFNQASLEHYENPLQILKDLRSMLAPGGILVIGVPILQYRQFPMFYRTNLRKGRAKSYFHAKHINHFSVTTFSKILQNSGLRILPFTTTFPAYTDYIDWNDRQSIFSSLKRAVVTLIRICTSYPFYRLNWYPEIFIHLYFSSYFICMRDDES